MSQQDLLPYVQDLVSKNIYEATFLGHIFDYSEKKRQWTVIYSCY